MLSSQLTNIFRRGWNHQPEKSWIYATLGILLSRSMMEKKTANWRLNQSEASPRIRSNKDGDATNTCKILQNWRLYKVVSPQLCLLDKKNIVSICQFVNISTPETRVKLEWTVHQLFRDLAHWGTLYKPKMQARITLEAGPGAQGTGGTTDQLKRCSLWWCDARLRKSTIFTR